MKISWTKRQHKFPRFYWRYHGRDSSWIMHMFFDWLGVVCFLRRHSNQVLLGNDDHRQQQQQQQQQTIEPFKPFNHLVNQLHEFFTADLLLHSQLGGGMRWEEKKRLWVQDSAAILSGKSVDAGLTSIWSWVEWSWEKRELPHEKLRSILSTPPFL